MNDQPTIDILIENDDKMLELVLHLINSYIDLQAQVRQQKRTISMQGKLIGQCVEHIIALEGRNILGNFNKRIEGLESWLYTHDYAYFQREEKQSGNSSFEDYEMHHPDPSYVEQEDMYHENL